MTQANILPNELSWPSVDALYRGDSLPKFSEDDIKRLANFVLGLEGGTVSTMVWGVAVKAGSSGLPDSIASLGDKGTDEEGLYRGPHLMSGTKNAWIFLEGVGLWNPGGVPTGVIPSE